MIDYFKYRIFRNSYGLKDKPSEKHRVNLEYSKIDNFGDALSPVIVSWMLAKRNLSLTQPVRKTKHLMAVGSVVSRGRFDATIWGSGVLKDGVEERLSRQAFYKKYDIRAVRGPITRSALVQAGYQCPETYGDPAILMPLLYRPAAEKKYARSLVLHHRTSLAAETNEGSYEMCVPEGLHVINPATKDYQSVIDEIVASESVISTSLHGIIIAESYGIPAVFLNFGVSDQIIKFDDWYQSTGRERPDCSSLREALGAENPPVPDLSSLRQGLLDSFPYDLWEDSDA